MLKKFLLIPDSFKGTMSSAEICGLMETAIRTHYPEAEIVSIPVADGGEGVSAIFSINRIAVPFSEAKPRSKSDLNLTIDNLMRFLSGLGV